MSVEVLRTDTVVATEIRDEMKEPLAKICELMARARSAGLKVDLGINPDAFGRFVPTISIVKPIL